MDTPDYSEEIEDQPNPDSLKKLGLLAAQMAQLMIQKEELEDQLKKVEEALKKYKENFVPEVMNELELKEITTKGGLRLELKEEIRASLPKDSVKRAAAFDYLAATGNSGLIKNEFTLSFGRNESEASRQFYEFINGPAGQYYREHGSVSFDQTVHHQTLLKFLRDERDAGRDVPMEAFGAFVQTFAKIKMG